MLRQSILFILLWLIFRDLLSTGQLISMQFILERDLRRRCRISGSIILQYREAEASLNHFDALMQLPTEQRPDDPVEVGAIERMRFEDVVFRYRDATEPAIDHISFRAELGDTIAFVGPSGSGKSTLVKLLVGLYTPVEGAIFVDDIPVTALRYNRVRRQIGFVTQDPQLFSGTIRENLQFVKADATDAEMVAALRRRRPPISWNGRRGAGHAARRRRNARLRRRAPAAVDRARAPARPRLRDLRRGDVGARLPHRAARSPPRCARCRGAAST